MKSSTNSEVHTKKKLLGDSGYECNYCNAKNHSARDCMLKKIIENKEKVKDEAYYVQKIEELKEHKDNTNIFFTCKS